MKPTGAPDAPGSPLGPASPCKCIFSFSVKKNKQKKLHLNTKKNLFLTSFRTHS